MAKLAAILILVLLASAGCGGTPSLNTRVPANHEIDAWTLNGSPTVADTDTKLYNLIDGGAPKYLDRGWVASVYAAYQQDTSTVQIFVHDMGTSDNALALYNVDLPVSRAPIGSLSNAVVDIGLPVAYAAEAYAGQYCIEASIDDRSDSALDAIQRFILATLKRCE